ncbi:MAG: putative toxin-antitoxin system toxin component, PIN family [Phycisphaerae bacterium]|nr:putative toxin-antitoxin system toxin component, PIN family [Phycisphaerae bacterium]
MRVVFDTNVLLSGVMTRGICEALLDVCLSSGVCTVVVSEHILDEFARHAETKFGAPADEIRRTVRFLRRRMELVEPVQVPVKSCRDPDDLPVLGTALAAGADCLVTGDRDLLDLGQFHSIPILSPRAFHDGLQR